MFSIALLAIGGLALTYAIFEAFEDDNDEDARAAETLPEEPQTGTAEDDLLTGGPGRDDLQGLDGDDTLRGGAGDDQLQGDNGNDQISGGTGNDRLLGGRDVDVLAGDAGNDTLSGQNGNDVLDGGSGNDRLNGGLGRDWLHGDAGDDRLDGGYGSDVLSGGTGRDELAGGAGSDLLTGGAVLPSGMTLQALVNLRDDIADGFLDAASIEGLAAYNEDGASDTLNGGDGDDVLILGEGDHGTGGAGADDFALFQGTPTAPSIIADFDADEDMLVFLHPAGSTSPAVRIETASDGSQAVLLDGVLHATLPNAGGRLTLDHISLVENTLSAG